MTTYGSTQIPTIGIIPNELLTNYQSNITRAEFCKMVVRMLMVKSGTGNSEEKFIRAFDIDLYAGTFNDISDIYIDIAHALRIVNGTGNGLFNPNASITRQEAAVMLSRAAAVFEFNSYSSSPVKFSDENAIAIWAVVGVNFVSANGIMTGVGNNMFSPHTLYTREQAIVTMLRLFREFPRQYYAFN